MLKKAEKTIKKYNMLKKGDKVVTGLSGGADSVALLLVLDKLKEKYDLKIYAVHVKHGIRGKEADEDCEFCRKLCEKMGVEFFVKEFDIPKMSKELGMSCEEAGRVARYDSFEEIRKKKNANKIAVAHNMNDDAETVIMRLCRGTGLKGLCGISAVRGNIVRPIINCSRKEIEDFVVSEGFSFQTDSTNLDDEYTRNRIRHNILPVLEKEINPSSIANIAKASEIISEEEDFIEMFSKESYKSCVLDEKDNSIIFDAERFNNFHAAVRKRIIRMAIELLAKSVKDISYTHIESVIDIFEGKTGRSYNLPYGLKVEKSYNLVVIKNNDDKTKDFLYNINIDEEIFVEECGIYVSISKEKPKADAEYKYFDSEEVGENFFVRSRADGDRIVINKDGRSKKVKDILIDYKVPRDERDKVAVIGNQKCLLWVYPYRSCAKSIADKNIKRCIHIEAVQKA